MGQLIVVTGGARSGKSSYALQRCEELGEKRCFVATCPVTDKEMAARIRCHEIERQGRGWQTIEEEQNLAQLLNSLKEQEIVLIDCLTLWVNNLLYRAQQDGHSLDEVDVQDICRQFIVAVNDFPGIVCCVTNEVGMGIVPDNPLARKYRDLVGCCNRYLARHAVEVVLVSCGLPLTLKPAVTA